MNSQNKKRDSIILTCIVVAIFSFIVYACIKWDNRVPGTWAVFLLGSSTGIMISVIYELLKKEKESEKV